MHLAKLALAVLGAAATLFAADSFSGQWKLNPGQSVFKSGQPAKDQTVNIDQQDDNYDITMTGTLANGSPMRNHYTVPIKGGEGKVIESKTYDAVTTQRIDDNTRENTFTKAGKQVLTTRATVEADGKTLRVEVKGTGPDGNPIEGTAVYDKQ